MRPLYPYPGAKRGRSICDTLRSGQPEVWRTFIPKGDGKLRPLGIPSFEDKVLQRAIVMLLEPVYEMEFLGCSHSYRPHRSAHGALESLWRQVMDMGGCWLIDADIKGFYDSVTHPGLKEMLNQRVGDGVVRRLVSKWLHAGVWEMGQVSYPEKGTPQGGVVSPLMSNIYRLVDFRPEGNFGGGGSFDFLGFTHTWRMSRKGNPYVCRTTSKSRFTRAMDSIKAYCLKTLTLPIPEQLKGLAGRLTGHFNYFGIIGNSRAIGRFAYETRRVLMKALRRRSGHHAHKWTWERLDQLMSSNHLPKPRVRQPYAYANP